MLESITQAMAVTTYYLYSVTREGEREPVHMRDVRLEPESSRLHAKKRDSISQGRKVSCATNTESEDIKTYSQFVDKKYIDVINSDDDISLYSTEDSAFTIPNAIPLSSHSA